MTITYVGSGAEATGFTGASAAVPYPAGIAAGDFLWVPASAGVSTAFATNAMSAAGFTRRYALNSGGSSPVGAGFYKIATGSETGTATLNSPGGTVVGRMFAYRGVDPTTPFDVADATFGSSTVVTAYNLPAQVTTIVGCTLVTHAWSNNVTGTWTPPASYTELMDSTAGGTMNATQVAHRLAWASSGDTGVRSIVRSAASRGGAAGIVLRPAGTEITAVVAGTLPKPTSAAGAVVIDLASVVGTLPKPTTAVAANVSIPTTVTGAAPKPATAVTVAQKITGPVAGTFPKMVSAAAVAVSQTGTVAGVFPSLSTAAVATLVNRATVAGELPEPTTEATAAVLVDATVAGTLPMPTTETTLSVPITGAVSATFPMLQASVVADVFLDMSQWKDITITVGTPTGNPFTVGTPTGHPFRTGPVRSD